MLGALLTPTRHAHKQHLGVLRGSAARSARPFDPRRLVLNQLLFRPSSSIIIGGPPLDPRHLLKHTPQRRRVDLAQATVEVGLLHTRVVNNMLNLVTKLVNISGLRSPRCGAGCRGRGTNPRSRRAPQIDGLSDRESSACTSGGTCCPPVYTPRTHIAACPPRPAWHSGPRCTTEIQPVEGCLVIKCIRSHLQIITHTRHLPSDPAGLPIVPSSCPSHRAAE